MNLFKRWLWPRSVRSDAMCLYKQGFACGEQKDSIGAMNAYTSAIELPDTPDDVKAMALYNRALILAAEERSIMRSPTSESAWNCRFHCTSSSLLPDVDWSGYRTGNMPRRKRMGGHSPNGRQTAVWPTTMERRIAMRISPPDFNPGPSVHQLVAYIADLELEDFQLWTD